MLSPWGLDDNHNPKKYPCAARGHHISAKLLNIIIIKMCVYIFVYIILLFINLYLLFFSSNIIIFGQIIINSYYLIIFPGGRGGCHPPPLIDRRVLSSLQPQSNPEKNSLYMRSMWTTNPRSRVPGVGECSLTGVEELHRQLIRPLDHYQGMSTGEPLRLEQDLSWSNRSLHYT